MKKIISMLLVCILCITVCGCNKKTETKELSLYDQGLSIVELMNEMVHNDMYGKVAGASTEMLDKASEIQQGDYSTPSSVYCISMPEDMLTGMIILMDMESSVLNDMSQNFRDFLNKKMESSIPIELNAYFGSSSLATAALYTAGKSFINSEIKNDAIYVYLYENGYPIMVQFSVGEDHIVGASGCFYMSTDYEDSIEGIKKMFSNQPMFGGSKIEKITQ